jgi:hypothetical protein
MTIKSHTTQVLQNYLDATDVRSRENPTSLEAQLLNMAAVELDDLSIRVGRELSQSLQSVPLNIDNGGVYYSGQVPNSLITSDNLPTFTNVIGKTGSTSVTLTPYDDTLPVPARVELGESVPLTDPILFTAIGTGDPQAQVYTVQSVTPGDLPIPNRLTFWVDQIGLNGMSLTLTIIGEIVPRPAWIAERKKTTEVVLIGGEGVTYSRNRWITIDSIAIRGLPLGVRLRAWSMPFALPAEPDPYRPYTTPQDRDVLFARYWQISNDENLLYEMYEADGFTGLEPAYSYSILEPLADIAVEPFTYGLYAASQTSLYYIDRREVMPDLKSTGLSVEPLFGLQVVPDSTKSGPTRYVQLSGIAYGNANKILQYRYTVNGVHSILPNGALGPTNAGWRSGHPETVSFAMLNTGDYIFQLEMQDTDGNTTIDSVPYKNAAFAALKKIDISELVDNVAGIAFDSYGQLWIWTGSFAFPVIIHYDGYVFDSNTRELFITDKYDSLQVS